MLWLISPPSFQEGPGEVTRTKRRGRVRSQGRRGGAGGGHKDEEEGSGEVTRTKRRGWGRSQGRRPPFCILSKEEGRLLYSRIHFECYPIGCFHWAGHYPVSGTMKKRRFTMKWQFHLCQKFYFLFHYTLFKTFSTFRAYFFAIFAVGLGREGTIIVDILSSPFFC